MDTTTSTSTNETTLDLSTVSLADLRSLYAAVGSELKRRKAAAIKAAPPVMPERKPVPVASKPEPKPAAEASKPAAGRKGEFAVRCHTTGKVLKRRFTTLEDAVASAAELTRTMRRGYVAVAQSVAALA
jgi:hypothetical protein